MLLASVTAPHAEQVTFVDVSEESGIDFQHTNGRVGKKFVIEVKGSGVALFDYDNDGDLDLYAVNGNDLPGARSKRTPTNRLYRNDGDGSFSDVTKESGVGHAGYGHGVAAADYDNDGDQDLYITNYGPNVLYRNNGDGTFTDVSESAGVQGPAPRTWSASAAFCDLDNDGDLDLYVANYLVFDIETSVALPLLPGYYDGEPDNLYLNNGDGTFKDVTDSSGVAHKEGKGLGVVCFDYDEDNDLDLYVANDGVSNLMFRNNGDATFENVTLISGSGLNGDGEAEAGMGIDAADYDNDGDMDLFVTNFKGESNTLYTNEGGGMFVDSTFQANLADASLPYVTFGTAFFDFDNDSDLDVFTANGSTFEDDKDYAQRNQLFENKGGRYEDVTASCGACLSVEDVSRGVAFGDYDNDGDVDVVVGNTNGKLNLLRNDGGDAKNWLMIRAVGTRSNRDGVGARVKISGPGFQRSKDVKSAYSIFSANDVRVHFGLDDREVVPRVDIRWPSGQTQTITNVPANKLLIVTEGGNHRIRDLGR
ncbi:hypothetical protein ABI59_19515 [Acidobacteria bacterium Mor1]|nr:hypothetical protein ABI59_19515 [Acidobacteria bacterium Mor1]